MKTNAKPEEERKRPHIFDGIQEYDKKLPNWWLATFYGTIIFSAVYWFCKYQHVSGLSDQQKFEATITQIKTSKLASASDGAINDATFWEMSRNPTYVDAGQKTYASMCASCHAENLTGRIGPNLIDRTWLHGGNPTEILHTVTQGVPIKGMPTWGPILGPKKISQLVAFIVSKHDRSEPEMNRVAAALPAGPGR